MYRPHVVLLNDEPKQLENTRRILEEAYEISLYACEEQLLAYLKQAGEADIIILDAKLREADCCRLIKKIKTIPSCNYTAVIILTEISDPETELHCLDCGALEYIKKPFDARVLKARIARILEMGGCCLDEIKLSALPEPLTETEWKIAKLLARSYSNDEICKETHYALDTVKKLVSSILEKMDIKNRKGIKRYIK